VLNGAKTFITNAPIADVMVVFATQDRSKGNKGISAFLVEKGFPGVSTTTLEKMGMKASPMGEIFFDDCKVPAQNLLGREGQGFAIAMSTVEWDRLAVFPAHVGHAEKRLKETIAYAKNRVQFGKPIAEFQAIQHKLADMKVWLETSRLMFYRVAWKKKNGIPAVMDASIAKLFFSETNRESVLNAFQIHGTYGYMKEYPIERDIRDTLPGTIGSGTSEIQRFIIARELLKSA
jgi:alkylation response protein AidB-like acyl-CoA dehydrogenase